MSKHIKWLFQEITTWTRDGLIDAGQAETLRQRYSGHIVERNWVKLFFTGFGAILIGLGIILAFAYNWEDMHKFVKLALVFTALLLAHGVAYHLRSSNKASPALTESLHLLGTMLFGAGIWLISQIYHINEHYPNAFIAWSLAALLLAWALPSKLNGILAIVLLAIWSGCENIEFRLNTHIAPFIVLFGFIPLSWMVRSRALLFMTLTAGLFCVFLNSTLLYDDSALIAMYLYGCLLITLNTIFIFRFTYIYEFTSLTNNFIGYLAYLPILYALTFVDFIDNKNLYMHLDVFSSAYVSTMSVILILAILLLVWSFTQSSKKFDELYTDYNFLNSLLMGFTFIAIITINLLKLSNIWLVAGLFNLIMLGHCILFVVHGSKIISAKLVAAGCILFIALVFARYVDLFDSLLLRSMAFVATGVVLFIVGHYYSQNKRKQQDNPT